MSGCDVIEYWNDTAFSGPGGRLDQLDQLIQEFMGSYGFDGAEVREQAGLMNDEGVPARYDPDSNSIFFDSDYLAGDSITPDEAVNLAIHEALHAMDALEDGGLDVTEGDVATAAFYMGLSETDDCECVQPDSNGDGGNTGDW